MEESLVPSLSSGVVGSRFVTQDEIEVAKARREEQWKAAYARLGQVPPQQQEDSYDGRSLAEKLAANKIAKQEAWEEKNKLANQFRALEEDEIMFLDSIRERQQEEERIRKERDGEEVKNFKEAVAARTSAAANSAAISITASASNVVAKPRPSVTTKKDTKRTLKGVVVKKKAKIVPADSEKVSAKNKEKEDNPEDDEVPPNAKRRKIAS